VVSGGLFANTLDLDATAPTIKVSGAQHLTFTTGSPALDTGPLVTFDASASTGGVTAEFFGTGSATVIGGSGADHFTFDATVGNITVSGGAGDDVFTFLSTKGGTATFGVGDSADGGPGNDLLQIQADHGEILQGGTITTIETVQHITNAPANGDFTADISQIGSATTLDLHGNYNGNDVVVNKLVDAVTIEYSGTKLDNLTLHHVGVIGTDNVLLQGGVTLNALHTELDIGLNLTSNGPGGNTIHDVSDVNSNVVVTGNSFLLLGDTGAYQFAGVGAGIIDAHNDTGGVEVFLAAGTTSQTFLGGSGNDTVIFNGFNHDAANFANGGNDTAQFEQANQDSTQALGANNYQHVSNWTTSLDAVNIDVPLLNLTSSPLDYTDTGAAVGGGDATHLRDYVAGDLINLSATHINFIKADTFVGGGTDAQGGFAASIGAGNIVTNAGTNSVLWAYYDAGHGQMVLGAVDVPFGGGGSIGNIQPTDHFDVIGTIGMSVADYQAFNATNLHFV
jgi:hypothetical protein